MTDKERYKDLKDRGICVYCKTAPAEDGKTTCRVCREKQRKQTAEKRAALRKMGICTECGSRRVYGDEKICPECAARKYASNLKCNRDPDKESQYHKDRRKKLKEMGICVKCGKRKAESGKTRCGICNATERIRKRRYRGNQIDRSERPSFGMCYFCGGAISKGRICSKCSERVTKNLPDKSNNKLWRMYENARIQQIMANKR